MEVLDPRMAVITGVGAALVGSERVRRTVGRGLGYAAAGALKVGEPIVRPVVNAGRDMVVEAREVAKGDGHAGSSRERTSGNGRSSASRTRSSRSRASA
jgi:hypothetical protein